MICRASTRRSSLMSTTLRCLKVPSTLTLPNSCRNQRSYHRVQRLPLANVTECDAVSTNSIEVMNVVLFISDLRVGNHRMLRARRHAVIAIALLAVLTNNAVGQDKSPDAKRQDP